MRRRKFNDESQSQQNWLLTYSDVITLVLCMFVMLYSFSTIDAQKFEQLVNSLNQTLSGVLDGGKIISPDPRDDLPIDVEDPADNDQDKQDEFDKEEKNLEETLKKISELIVEHGLEDFVFIGMETKGIEIRFSDGVFFDSGSALIKPSATELLNKLSLILMELENEILVEGHTDNRPMNSPQFPSNWELSTGRSISVVKYFINRGIEPSRVGALGFGEYRPIDTNSTPEGRQANRRVNIIVLRMND